LSQFGSGCSWFPPTITIALPGPFYDGRTRIRSKVNEIPEICGEKEEKDLGGEPLDAHLGVLSHQPKWGIFSPALLVAKEPFFLKAPF
jgi:hypothetical protein